MKATVRAQNAADWNLTSLVTLYPMTSRGLCLQCRLRAITALRSNPPITYLPPSNRRHASESITSRIRSRIWGSAAKNAPKATPGPSAEEVEAERLERDIEDTDKHEKELWTSLPVNKHEEELWTSLPVDTPDEYKPALSAYGLPHTSDFLNIRKDPERRYKR